MPLRHNNFRKEKFTEKERRCIDILEILRRRGPVSRPDISEELGINVVSISSYIDEFIRSGLVSEKELDVSEGGRRPELLDLNPQAGFIIGVGMNLMNMVGVLIDLKGNIITKAQLARPGVSVREIAECMLELIREVLRRSKEYTSNIRGVGVGIAGLVNKRNGSVRWPQKSDHHYTYASVDLPLAELIDREFNLPGLIENDAASACFGERWLDLNRGLKNIVYMFSGVGCGIIINGEIYTGSQGYAGEPAIYNYKGEDLFNCQAGNTCFLKRWEIDLGIAAGVRQLLNESKARDTGFGDINNIDLKSVFNAARAGNPIACQALDSAAGRLGIKIAFLVNLLNPEVVVIGGGLEDAGEAFLSRVNSTIKDWAFRETSEDLIVVYSRLRENAVALGAASLVMERIYAGLL